MCPFSFHPQRAPRSICTISLSTKAIIPSIPKGAWGTRIRHFLEGEIGVTRQSSSMRALLNQVLPKSYSPLSSSRSYGFIINDAAQPRWGATVEFEYVRCRCARRLCRIPHAWRLFLLPRGLRGAPTVSAAASDKGERGEIVSASCQEAPRTD